MEAMVAAIELMAMDLAARPARAATTVRLTSTCS
jgi:hypothetical protein